MSLFRHRTPAVTVATRFADQTAVFCSARERDLHVTQVAATMERNVDLLHALAEHLPQVVDLSLECLRSGRRFVGEGLSLAEVRETIARLKVPLVQGGGVELAVYTPEDQLALSPMLDLWIYSKSDRWVYLLVGEGLDEVAAIEPRTWHVARREFAGAPELVEAIEKTAERLTLRLL
ncbi:MAG: hypothetical protein WCS99_23040 [Limisphaerales bacterium]